jgi:hypothetical protein
LPLFEGYMPTIFGIMLGFWFLEGDFKNRFQNFPLKSGIVWSLFFYFLLSLTALIYSQNQQKAWFDVQQKIALLVFPVFIIGQSTYFWKHKRILLWAFVAGLFIASIYDIAYAIHNSFVAGESEHAFRYWVYEKHENVGFIELISMRMSYFSYAYLSRFLHPSYFAMYLVFSLAILRHLHSTWKESSKWINLFYYLLGLFFILMVLILQSTAGLISLVVILIYLFAQKISSKFNLRKSILIFSVTLLSIFGLIAIVIGQNDHLRIQIEQSLEKGLSTSSSVRLIIWKNASHLALQNKLLGISPGDVRDQVKTVFEKSDNIDFASGNYNMHNQFLETYIGLGLLGLFLLISLLALGLKLAIKNKDALLITLLIIIMINFSFESILNRQSGIFFFLFFLSLLAFDTHRSPLKN